MMHSPICAAVTSPTVSDFSAAAGPSSAAAAGAGATTAAASIAAVGGTERVAESASVVCWRLLVGSHGRISTSDSEWKSWTVDKYR